MFQSYFQKERNFFDLVAAIGVPTTMVAAYGKHSELHMLLAFANLAFCVTTLWLPIGYKKWPMMAIVVVLIIALATNGF